MSLRFVNRTAVESADELTPLQQEQLAESGRRWDGEDRTAAEWLDPDGEGFAGHCERWDVVTADGSVAYDAWLYAGDSGTIFTAGTTEVVAEVIQDGLECDDEDLEAELEPALDNRNKR